MKKDFSYGVIPIKKFGNEWKVFLINQYSKIGNNTYWILPKGHAEGEETPRESALRELYEETALTPDRLIEDPDFHLKYKFKFDGKTIDKTVIFYVGIIKEDNHRLQEEEVVEAGWYTLDEATARLDYQNAKNMFAGARSYIEKLS